MADWHLSELDQALMEAGWKVVDQMPGDEHKVSATWAIQRNSERSPLLVDFQGQAETECLPILEAYACAVRHHTNNSLYFGKEGNHWLNELGKFITALNRLENEQELSG